MEEPVKPALGHTRRNLGPREPQPLQLRPRDDAELATRQPGQRPFSARVFCITMRRFTLLAHLGEGGSARASLQHLWQKIYAS